MGKPDRVELIRSIANTIADYRQGEITIPDADHVNRWINQFDASVQQQVLSELDHILKKTYLARTDVEKFLSGVISSKKLTGKDPRAFWKKANILHIQEAGNSQREMLAMFDTILRSKVGLGLKDCGSSDGPFIYLDDAVFTGNRLKHDLFSWIQSSAPAVARLHVIVIGLHCGGQWYAETQLEKVVSDARKKLDLRWWRCLKIEDRRAYLADSDVLRPTALPSEPAVQAYAEGLKYAPDLRAGTGVGGNKFFSSHAGRIVLEQEFLKAGVRIRDMCPNLNQYQRPLGNTLLQTLGFGALMVTFRNCPNNCPLAFWVDSPWYPLFPRKTN